MELEEEDLCTPPELKAVAKEVSLNLLPPKSQEIYKKAYNKFTTWRIEKKAPISENVVLAYLNELYEDKKRKPTTLWSTYSFLKTTIKLYDKIDISKFSQVFQYLKLKSMGYVTKKAKIFKDEEVLKFLNDAPNEQFLATKVAMVFAVFGALRIDELTHITMNDVQQEGNILLVNIPQTKTYVSKSFTISGEFYTIVKEYMNLRPSEVPTNRFFLGYRNGKCIMQPIGKNTLGKMPFKVASFLKLKDLDRYTGHSFRRSSTSLLSNSGADKNRIKRHGGWKSDKTADIYIEESIEYKKDTEKMLSSSLNLKRKDESEHDKRSKNNSDDYVLEFEDKTEPLVSIIESNKVLNLENGEAQKKKGSKFVFKTPKFPHHLYASQGERVLETNQDIVTPSFLTTEDIGDYIIEEFISQRQDQEPAKFISPKLPHNFTFNNCNVNFNFTS